MIRPVTCVSFLLACASGLYLYQSKHRVQVLDRQIEQTVHATDALREQTRILHAEWTLMNDPQRLQALADQFLSLKTVAPGQFTNLAELNTHLPAARAPEPPPKEVIPEPAPLVVAQGQGDDHSAGSAADALPMPPIPPKPPVAASVSPLRVADAKANPPHPLVALVAPPRPPEVRPQPEPRITTAAFQPSPPRVVTTAVVRARPATDSVSGAFFGMAHAQTTTPPPAVAPVSAPAVSVPWNSNGGGGN